MNAMIDAMARKARARNMHDAVKLMKRLMSEADAISHNAYFEIMDWVGEHQPRQWNRHVNEWFRRHGEVA